MHEQIAERLRNSSGDILAIWERRARTEIIATAGKDSKTVQDELSLFLGSLVSSLERSNPLEDLANERAAISHGQQRSGLTDYTLIQIIEEYSLMRQVLIQILSELGPIDERDRMTIHLAVDTAMEYAANEFAKSEQSKIVLALAKSEKSNRELEQFAAVVAHDFRSPLATISGFVEVLEDELAGIDSTDVSEPIDYIKKAISRLFGLVDGILSYAKLNGERLAFQLFDSETAVSAAVQNLQNQLTETNGRVEFSGLPKVCGEFVLLTQLFQNLIANSLKFKGTTPPIVRITSKRECDFWKFSVSDNGIGFDPSKAETIFALYNRGHASTGSAGAGIGLATCRRVVELHGGKIWAESQPGHGSTFYFTISAQATIELT